MKWCTPALGFAVSAGMLPALLQAKVFLVVVDPLKPLTEEEQNKKKIASSACSDPSQRPELLPSTKAQRKHTLSVDDSHLEAARDGNVVHMLLSGEHYELLYPNKAQWAKRQYRMRTGTMSGDKDSLLALTA
jgi:uncharacterized membrane protein YhiD involved in acid resistance